jgi:ubiquinone biosynthesis monooxygenase Coq7
MEVIARLAADESLGDRVIKVNHAGEHGAVNIYRAQLLAHEFSSIGRIRDQLRCDGEEVKHSGP